MSVILPDELPSDFEFGGYVIRACIGRGGMARVYRAEQAALHRPVALKVLDRWVLEKPQGAQRFLREARAAAAIKHPNVVDIVDVGVWEERPYIVMELLNGSDLETHLAQYGTLSDGAVAGLALPIIAGMMAVHEAGVVHRDLKPSNIFLSNGADGDIIPKVLDFGVSKFNDKFEEPVKGNTKTREIIGTPTYMAPEALNGVKELGPRADQYALGAVLYECATGRPPFEGETLLELLKAIAVGNIPAPRSVRPEISITLEDAILRAMNGNPKARFETLRDFGRALWPLADDRSKTIWARSFGNGRATTFGSGETAGLVLVGQHRMPESRTSGSAWPSLRKLSGVGAFVALGALAALYVLRPWQSGEPEVAALGTAKEAPLAAAAPAVERRSLLADSARPSQDPSVAPAADPAGSNAAVPGASAPSAADAPASTAARVDSPALAQPRGAAVARAATPARATNPLPRATKAANLAMRRKRPTRSDLDVSGDSELDGLFTTPAPVEGRRALDAASVARSNAASAERSADNKELDGLFPGEASLTFGANGSPLPD